MTVNGPNGAVDAYFYLNGAKQEPRAVQTADAIEQAGRNSVRALREFIEAHPHLLILTGAGCSTASGIPDYRDDNGEWKHPRPVQFQEFVREPAVRQRYWGRGVIGWRRIAGARPNATHRALARLESLGLARHLITQNVDGLHQRAGSRRVIDLHGRLDRVRCLQCDASFRREVIQREMELLNPEWQVAGRAAPDGDVHVENVEYASFRSPVCLDCDGVLKPDVVFFGENVPRDRVAAAFAELDGADALLVVGSSLMVYSGFRFARAAAEAGKPIAIVNLGRTRADELVALSIAEDCSLLIPAVVEQLYSSRTDGIRT